MKQTLKEAGYVYLTYLPSEKCHILLNVSAGAKERFFANKNHASWGLIYKNTHLEFASTVDDEERIVLEGDEAKQFYHETTKDHKYTDFGSAYAQIGGWFESEIPGVYNAYDFTNGEEVFIEDFTDLEEAKKYAAGQMARTRSGMEI